MVEALVLPWDGTTVHTRIPSNMSMDSQRHRVSLSLISTNQLDTRDASVSRDR
jgi:hypothetical protein